jgi:hypothetical protein
VFGFFTSPPFTDGTLGELRRARAKWRGNIRIGEREVPLAISGSRTAPDATALDVARSIADRFETWRQPIAEAMFEHYAPYAESVAAGEDAAPAAGLPSIARASDVWPHLTPEFVQVGPLDGELTIEIGYRAAWDEKRPPNRAPAPCRCYFVDTTRYCRRR